METIFQREFISKTNSNLLPGFTSKSSNQQTYYNQPFTGRLRVETNHVKRDIQKSINKIMPLLEYQVSNLTNFKPNLICD